MPRAHQEFAALLAALLALLGAAGTAAGADLGPGPAVPARDAPAVPRSWTFSFTPYS